MKSFALIILGFAANLGRADPETTPGTTDKYKEACIATVGSIFS